MLVLDRMNDISGKEALYAFALDELLCRRTGRGGAPVCHIWRHPQAFILGLADSRLSAAGEARRQLEKEGWSTAVRNSGGAAVPLDLGVVNVSLILPKDPGKSYHFHDDFELMYRLLQKALEPVGRKVEKGEIAGAYCPGEYDLSIGGYKFCGIAQRRQTHAVIIQAFIVAEGSGRERASRVRDFYEQASAGSLTGKHPVVTGESTASLEELAPALFGDRGAETFAAAVKNAVLSRGSAAGEDNGSIGLDLPDEDEIADMTRSLRARY
ncbi:lipoate--protein ligase family protein [Paenibacillus vietnamensis]|uniref:lipoate--protein ligase family protein n=1 Tax=Paenibacillus vietnamensis TaxID=2590547 RepID=UPI002964C055|nr:lipoate--protein ligase family protein [Paenibacillus vietnamensis]